ncbi:MAG TPA: protein kinase [Gaiellaceae bacterium]|nr:protein kinase [Gaiellaceae bacterium]
MGELIADRYELAELVGTGGMSSVYRAHDRLLERDVALKVLHEQFTADTDYVERFRREARSVAQLSHPNIVTVIDRGEQDGRQFIVFEYIDGENLKSLVEREGALPEDEAVRLTLQVARGLGFAHDNGLVHRDVKPQNVLLNGAHQAKVTDFGIARSLDVKGGLTQTGTVMGTSDYIAPEQARGAHVDEQSDIYSLGVVLYELLTGEVPFPGDNFVAVAMRHINEPPPSVREHRPDVSPRVDAAIRRAMAKEPRDRFGSMNEFCAELTASLAPESDTSGAQTMVVPGRRPSRPPADRPSIGPLLLLLGGLAVLAGILAAVFAFTDPGGELSNLVGKKSTPAAHAGPVHFTAAAAYDPLGDNSEHDAQAGNAIDGDPGTYWNTEHYNGALPKKGVGLVVGMSTAKKLSKLTVRSDTQGFTATIESGSSATGPFKPVSASQQVGGNTTFSLKGDSARYYLVWITNLGSNSSVEINEVKGS